MTALPILQSFALANKINEIQLGQAKFFSTIFNGTAMILLNGRAGRLGVDKIVKRNQFLHGYLLVLPLFCIALCLMANDIQPIVFFFIFTLGWIIYGVINGYWTIINSRLQAYLFMPEKYGIVFGISGLVNYFASAAVSFFIMSLLTPDRGTLGFGIIFGASLLFGIITIITSGKLTPVYKAKTVDGPVSPPSWRKMVKNKQTALILAVHLIRGLNSGIYYFIIPIGFRYFALSQADIGMVTFLGAVAGAAAYFGISIWLDKIGEIKMSLLSLALEIVSIVPLLFFRGTGMFMMMYLLFNIGNMALAQIIPIGILKTSPVERIAFITAFRLVILMLADAVTSVAVSGFLEFFGFLLIAMCVLKIVKGVLIIFTFRKKVRA